MKSMVVGGIQVITFSGYLPNFKTIWHFEDKLPQLHCQYPKRYAGFVWQKVKQNIEAPGPLADISNALRTVWSSLWRTFRT